MRSDPSPPLSGGGAGGGGGGVLPTMGGKNVTPDEPPPQALSPATRTTDEAIASQSPRQAKIFMHSSPLIC
ncbi:hypothetical protein DBV14_18900 [Variovorax sp. KBW07]|nr:hypothetical protein DBV14_18900 [Variovorax sp. KBW07]